MKICDLCGSTKSEFILTTTRLDGPLMQCSDCGLFYVDLKDKDETNAGGRNGSTLAAEEMIRLAGRARELSLVEPGVEESERPWRQVMASERLNDLKRFVKGGRLLEIGCSTGELLEAAGESFIATGVEADPASSRIARSSGLDCYNGTLKDAGFPDQSFDAVVFYHVIEHFRSPHEELSELRRIVKPGGWLAIETPNIETVWYRLLGARWRQFIPDHIYFFSPQTMTRLCREHGFTVSELRTVGKAMSLRLFISRLGRYHRSAASLLASLSRHLHLSDRTLRVNLGDVMRVYAQRR